MKNQDIYKKLYKHQVESIQKVETYLNSSTAKHQALVKLPTGAGKTGVISIVSNFYDDYKNTLVIVPNSVLPLQTKKEMEQLFWENINYDYTTLNLKPCFLVDKLKEYVSPNADGSVLILTVQMLNSIHKNNKVAYNKIKSITDLVIFDEGHREPATEWSSINREFGKKTILFTATPYRNDDKAFLIHYADHYYNYSHNRAISDSVINDVEFSTFEHELIKDNKRFAELVYNEYLKDDKSMIMVKINNHEVIKYVVDYLNSKGKGSIAIGCHSRFQKLSGDFISEGKSLSKMKEYSIYINYDMLVEGLNIPTMNKLIIHSGLGNTKSLIQLIGRVIRFNKDNPKSNVIVPKPLIEEVENQWNLYLEYDDFVSAKKKDDELNIYYNNGKFKRKIEFDVSYKKYLSIPKAGNFFVSSKTKIDEAIQLVREDLFNKSSVTDLFEDCVNNTWVLCYEKISYSNLLHTKTYEEKTLEVVVIREVKKTDKYYLSYYDSRGYSLPAQLFTNDLDIIPTENLYNLYSETSDIKSIRLNSVGISKVNINTREFHGELLQNTNTNIDERLSFCNSLKGKVTDGSTTTTSRYVSISTSRINDNARVTLPHYEEWVDNVVDELEVSKPKQFFNRFASICNPQKKLTPTSILVDLSSLNDENYTIKYGGQTLESVDSITADIVSNQFTFEFHGSIITGKVELTKINKRKDYIIDIPMFDSVMISNDGRIFSLNKYINRSNFRLFFSKDSIIFSSKRFFKPNIEFSNVKLNDLDISKRIIPMSGMDKTVNEKIGEETTTNPVNTWQLSSVFGQFLDHLDKKTGILSNYEFTHIVCDDEQTEIADFIAIDVKNNYAVLIHCKNYSSVGTSASAFQDVCGQTQKNVQYLLSHGIEDKHKIKLHTDRWDTNWIQEKDFGKGKIIFDCKRMIKGRAKGKGFWERYKTIIKKHNAIKEVWIVTNSLSRKNLDTQLKSKDPRENVNQLLWLLYGTQDVVSSAGADLKVFCCE